jgi:arabinogalactan oligomer / maltooligosaccharide transport system permease protein
MTDTVKTATPPERAAGDASGGGGVKAQRMPFGRWMRLVGWRHVVAVLMVAWALFPALYIISLSLSGGNTLTSACPPDRSGLAALSCLVPNKIDFSNYSTLLSSDQYPFVTWMKNSLILATGSATGALLMGAAAAYAFSRMRFTGRRMGMLSLMLVQMFPAVLAITAVYLLLTRILEVFPAFGLGHIWGTLLIYLGTALGVNTFLMKGYFDTIPVDLDESARIDGAGHARIFFDLIMRLALPILVVVFFVSFQSTFNELPIASVTLSDSQNTTTAVGLASLVSNPLIQEWGLMAAGGVMMAVPLFTLFLFTQKSLVTGLTAGAVKG